MTRYRSPDGLDWRDPEMPVVRRYEFTDGRVMQDAPPEFERRFREHCIEAAPAPGWRDDPTYNMSRRRKL